MAILRPIVSLQLCALAFSAAAQISQPASHELIDSVLWTQTAVEHDAVYEQAYRQARAMLDRARRDKKWTAAVEQSRGYERLPPAVILDIDETILDNSPEEAEIARGGDRPKLWEEWVSQERATALPGALAFTRYAAANHVEVIYVTNRDAALKGPTMRTLERLGFPLQHAAASIYCRGEKPEWTSDKGSRRALIAQRYRILLLIGDDLGDFLSGVRVSPEERRRIAAAYSDRWGERWILLPNPMYGSWEAALYGNDSSLTNTERLRLKRERLRPMQQ
jgi:acid phosphatase